MRRYLVFSAVALGLLLYSISGSAISVAFPVIIEDFGTTLVLAGWVLTAFQLVSTIVMPLSGKVTEVFGEKTTFMGYTLLFTIGSALCAIAPNIESLIGFRVIQAIGGGGFLPCAAGIVSNEFPESRQRFIGLFSSIFPIGMIIGPNLGGWLVEAFGWRSTFWLNVPLGIIIVVLARLLLRPGKRGTTSSSIDLMGAGLLFSSLLAFMFGLTTIGNSDSGIPWAPVGVLFAAAIGLMFVFVQRERRARAPFIDLELLVKRPFLAANVYNIIYGLSGMGIFTLVPLYAVTVYDMTILQSGVVLTARSIGMVIASTVTSLSLLKLGYRWPIFAGTLIMAAGLFLLSLQSRGIEVIGLHIGATPLLFIILGFCGIGHGVCTPASSNACIELMPEKVSTIVGLRGMFRQLGMVIGISASTVFLHYMGDMQRAFHIVFLASALLTVISIPTAFLVPASPKACAPREKSL